MRFTRPCTKASARAYCQISTMRLLGGACDARYASVLVASVQVAVCAACAAGSNQTDPNVSAGTSTSPDVNDLVAPWPVQALEGGRRGNHV